MKNALRWIACVLIAAATLSCKGDSGSEFKDAYGELSSDLLGTVISKRIPLADLNLAGDSAEPVDGSLVVSGSFFCGGCTFMKEPYLEIGGISVNEQFDGYIFKGYYFDASLRKIYVYAGLKKARKTDLKPLEPDKWYPYGTVGEVEFKETFDGGKAIVFSGFNPDGKGEGGITYELSGCDMTLHGKSVDQSGVFTALENIFVR